MTEYIKYPRTWQLPWSDSNSSDDVWLKDVKHFEGKEVVVSEKLDGECFVGYRGHCHARSIDSGYHESRTYVRKLWGDRQYDLPEGMRVCGENVFAEHSIRYDELTSYLYAFSVWKGKYCLPWDDTLEWLELLNLEPVPVLYEGIWDEAKVKACMTGKSHFGGLQEGYVVRVRHGFFLDDFSRCLAKYVRHNHVQTSQHWMYEQVTPNGLKEPTGNYIDKKV